MIAFYGAENHDLYMPIVMIYADYFLWWDLELPRKQTFEHKFEVVSRLTLVGKSQLNLSNIFHGLESFTE